MPEAEALGVEPADLVGGWLRAMPSPNSVLSVEEFCADYKTRVERAML